MVEWRVRLAWMTIRLIIALAKSFFRWFFDIGAQRAVPLYLGHGSPCPYGEITLGNPYKPWTWAPA